MLGEPTSRMEEDISAFDGAADDLHCDCNGRNVNQCPSVIDQGVGH